MVDEERVEILEKSFDLLEDCAIKLVVKDNESKTFENIRSFLMNKLNAAKTPKERDIITETYRKIENMTYDELLELNDLLSDDELEYDNDIDGD